MLSLRPPVARSSCLRELVFSRVVEVVAQSFSRPNGLRPQSTILNLTFALSSPLQSTILRIQNPTA